MRVHAAVGVYVATNALQMAKTRMCIITCL